MEILTDKRSKIQPFHLLFSQQKSENTTQKESQASKLDQRQAFFSENYSQQKSENTTQKESQAFKLDQRQAFFSENYSQQKSENTVQNVSQAFKCDQRRQPKIVQKQQWQRSENTTQKESQAFKCDQRQAFFSGNYSQQKSENTTQKESQAFKLDQRRQPKIVQKQQWQKSENTVQTRPQAFKLDQRRAFFSGNYSQQKSENTIQKASQAKDSKQRRQPRDAHGHCCVFIQKNQRSPQLLQDTRLRMSCLMPKCQAFTLSFNAEATALQTSVLPLAVEFLLLGGVA